MEAKIQTWAPLPPSWVFSLEFQSRKAVTHGGTTPCHGVFQTHHGQGFTLVGIKHMKSCAGWTFFCPGSSTLGVLSLPPRASVSPCGMEDPSA